ncbi:MAG: DUF4115 domain-containing protein, partial [Pseudomonadota bacterium]|nr:DUF4115 domain-containing protein [Pseudomonadota bacterium]
VATRQHLAGGEAAAAPLDAPVDARSGASMSLQAPSRTVVASMTPVPAAPMASSDIVIRTSDESWLEVVARDGSTLERGLLAAGSERRFVAAQVAHLTIGNATAVELRNQGRNVDMALLAQANVARFTVSSDGSLVAADQPRR